MSVQEPDGSSPETDRQSLEPRRLSAPRAAGIAGLVFAALFTTSLLLTRYYSSISATGADTSTVTGRRAVSVVALYLIPFSGIAFLWFLGVVRDRIGIYEDKFFATIFLGSGILFVAMLFAAASVLAAVFTVTDLTPAVADFGRSLARSLLYVYAARSAGVFTMVTSTILLRTGATPRVSPIAGFVIGLLLLLTLRFYDLVILLFPLWVALLSLLILLAVRRRRTA